MKKSFLLIGCAILFTGCTVRGPSVDLPSVNVDSPVRVIPSNSSYDDDDHKHKHKRGKGCPPGLAKQGRC